MEQIGAVKEGTGLLRDFVGWIRGRRRQPKLVVTAEVGTAPFASAHGDRAASFIWLTVRNKATSAHSDAHGVLGHLWVYNDAGREVFTLRARWRRAPTPTQVAAGTITDRLTIGSGLAEQLDAIWKYPDEATAFALNTEAIEHQPTTWQDPRFALAPGHYRLRVKVEPTNGPASEAAFPFVQPGIGSLIVDASPSPAVELDDLSQAADVLAKLAASVPAPRDDMDAKLLVFALIAVRARSLYGNVLHALSGPIPAAGPIAIVPLVELGILVKWLSIDPVSHSTLWVGDSDATDITMVASVTELMTARGNPPADRDQKVLTVKKQNRDAARAQLRAAGRDYGDRLIPPLEQMVAEVEVAFPGFRAAIRESYHMAYQVFSPWSHTDASSFPATAAALDDGHWRFVDDEFPFKPIDVKAIATSAYAFIVETVLIGMGSEDAAMARAVRTFVTQHWVRPEPTI